MNGKVALQADDYKFEVGDMVVCIYESSANDVYEVIGREREAAITGYDEESDEFEYKTYNMYRIMNTSVKDDVRYECESCLVHSYAEKKTYDVFWKHSVGDTAVVAGKGLTVTKLWVSASPLSPSDKEAIMEPAYMALDGDEQIIFKESEIDTEA